MRSELLTDPLRSRGLMAVGVAALVVMLCTAPASAFEPPVATAGPLTVRIEGPKEVTQLETPVAVRVVLENKGTSDLKGTVELKLIDAWLAEPARAVPFSVDAQGSVALEFHLVAGKKTYDAHYPLHVFVRFEAEGKPLVAHPILIFETKIAQRSPEKGWHEPEAKPPSAPSSDAGLTWEPFAVPEQGTLALWQLPVYRAVLEVFGDKPRVSPLGWQGSEPQTRAGLEIRQATAGDAVREAIVIHPPWYGGHPGTMLIEYPLTLPKTTPIALEFANAMQPEGQSDGVTFRVRVASQGAPEGELGEVVFQRHTDAKTWQPATADLSRFAGQAIRLQLESHPGPKNDVGWDLSYWSAPTLVVGAPTVAAPFPPTGDEGSQLLGTLERDKQRYEVRFWPGQRGLLDAAVGFAFGPKKLLFHGFQVRVLGTQLEDPRAAIILEKVTEETLPQGRQLRHHFRSLWGEFDLVGRIFLEQSVLRVKFHLENAPAPRPWRVFSLEDVAAGSWDQEAKQVYAGDGNVLRRPGPWEAVFDGHFLSTSFVGFDFDGGLSLVQGVDSPPNRFSLQPERRHYSLHSACDCQFTFIPTDNVWEGVRTWHDVNGLEAAGGVETAAGRMVFDLWGGKYADSAQALQLAFRYGLTHTMVVWHNWQRWGYDYRLPEIYPPNPQFGTIEEMRALSELCAKAGVPFAPHDNYIDFYPDAEGFSYEKTISFGAKEQPSRGWLNEACGAQAYRYRADAVEPFLQANLGLNGANLAPTAYFIDVWSSAGPYAYWTSEGRFFSQIDTREVIRRQFAWIRQQLGGRAPQISESGHDQLIGFLDGAQTNHLRVDQPKPGPLGFLVWPVKCEDAERTPWYDAAHHDRFVLHGAGYPGRYEAGLDPELHGIYSDDYLTTEMLTGHPAMVAEAFGRNVVRKYWLTSEVMRGLALKRIESVEYVDGNLHRQHVRWSGGGEVWANRGPDDWTVGETVLPSYGFLVRVPTEHGLAEASVCRHDGLIAESAFGPEGLYVNGRRVVEGPWPIQPAVEKIELQKERGLKLKLAWQVDTPIPAGWLAFFHFVDPQGKILFQADQTPNRSDGRRLGTMAATATATLPSELKPGTAVELRVGIWNPDGGERWPLVGPDDGTRRIRLGELRLEGEGDRISNVVWKPTAPEEDPRLARLNPRGKTVDFGAVLTSGGCRLALDEKHVVVTPLPLAKGASFPVTIRWPELPWKVPKPSQVQSLDEEGKVLGTKMLERSKDTVTFACEPGVFQYRLTRP